VPQKKRVALDIGGCGDLWAKSGRSVFEHIHVDFKKYY
jgi:hypothetical protein